MMDRYEYLSAYAKMRHGCIYEENRGIGFFRAEQLKRMEALSTALPRGRAELAQSLMIRCT